MAKRLPSEVLEAFREIYGEVPPEAVGWIRSLLAERFQGYAKGRGATLVENRDRLIVPAAGVQENLDAAAGRAKRDLEIILQPIELRARLRTIAIGVLPSAAAGERTVDAFISHASEDTASVARPLADALIARGYRVWLDRYELKIGDSVYASIDEGLRRSRFGVVILSRHFFAKNWPQRELHALAALSAAEGSKKILPVWHGIDHKDLAQFSPLLADVLGAHSTDGIEAIAAQIASVLGSKVAS